jgi:hydrogenase/urease accessory protein HupE
MARWLAIVLLLVWPAMGEAHEARPAYLQLQQLDSDSYDVLWKVPGQGEDRRLALEVDFAEDVDAVGRVRRTYADNAFVDRWRVRRAGGLDGSTIRIVGLQSTLTDVLVRLERLDGTTQTIRVQPSAPAFLVEALPGRWQVARAYLALGVEHILLGVDHLLFVLALVILVEGTRRLVWTITAFTAAHSLTLGAATLGWVHVPGPPVEATIALSIVFVAAEIIRDRQGKAGLTSQAPWLVAFGFGLLHGLGFAGALVEVGLPQRAIPTALLCFNVGVEIGQLIFVAIVLAAMKLLRQLPTAFPRWAPLTVPYAIGGTAMFWTLDRVVAFWS